MLVGLDFDNTIVCYDGLFHWLAAERSFVPPPSSGISCARMRNPNGPR